MTEYRIITRITLTADRYLQFKSIKRVRCWPLFWKKKEKEVWRYVPEERYTYAYVHERHSPTRIYFFNEGGYLNSDDWNERNLASFVLKYPNIQNYFDEMNRKRDEYIEKRKQVKTTPTKYLP